jgi:hypothetical protein
LIQKDKTDIYLCNYEGEKSIENDRIKIDINVASHFSSYNINPNKAFNFGPIMLNESHTRHIEIRNAGKFNFPYEISEYLEEATMKRIKEEKDKKENEEHKQKDEEIKIKLMFSIIRMLNQAAKEPVANNDKDKSRKGKNEIDVLIISIFTINNYKGVIVTGYSVKIDITFNTEGNKLYSNTLAIDIDERDLGNIPLGISIDIVAESCILGIDTKDFDNIFEEQTVLASLNPEINKLSLLLLVSSLWRRMYSGLALLLPQN